MNINKYIFLAAFFLSSTALTANEITGSVTSESGEGISFASIFLRQKNIGIVSDIDGHYRLPLDILEETGDTLIFSSIGFDVVRIPVALFAEKVSAGNTDIVLTANYVLLPEVSVTPSELRDYGFFHLRSGVVTMGSQSSGKFLIFIENTSSRPKIIQTINIRLANHGNVGFEKFRIFFYQKNEIGFQNINVGEDIFITDFSQSRIRHDVSEHHILFPAEGIFLGIEVVGEENVMQEREQPLSFYFSAITRMRGVAIYSFDDENDSWVSVRSGIEEIIDDIPRIFRNMVRNITPQIGLTAH